MSLENLKENIRRKNRKLKDFGIEENIDYDLPDRLK